MNSRCPFLSLGRWHAYLIFITGPTNHTVCRNRFIYATITAELNLTVTGCGTSKPRVCGGERVRARGLRGRSSGDRGVEKAGEGPAERNGTRNLGLRAQEGTGTEPSGGSRGERQGKGMGVYAGNTRKGTWGGEGGSIQHWGQWKATGNKGKEDKETIITLSQCLHCPLGIVYITCYVHIHIRLVWTGLPPSRGFVSLW